jgi:C-terminal processing protease CtpA/Prc
MADLLQVAYPSFGFQLHRHGASVYAGTILEGGPAGPRGTLTGDRIVTVDGTPVEESPRLDWRIRRCLHWRRAGNPSVRRLMAAAADRIALRVERRPGEFVNVTIAAED